MWRALRRTIDLRVNDAVLAVRESVINLNVVCQMLTVVVSANDRLIGCVCLLQLGGLGHKQELEWLSLLMERSAFGITS